MPKITLMIGISCSGKSTKAKILAEQNNALIVSRDKLRELLFGYTESNVNEYYNFSPDHLFKKEKTITSYQNDIIFKTLKEGKDVIVDNTNLKLKYIKEFIKAFHKYQIDFILNECSLDQAIQRDKLRIRQAGEDLIKKQHQDLHNLKKSFDFKSYEPTKLVIKNDPSKRPCIVFDIDGTLALKGDRNAFDWKAVYSDKINSPVYSLYQSVSFDSLNDFAIIICSGRDSICRIETEAWLSQHTIEYNQLLMREEKDMRPDYIVKQEMWEQICKDYYIEYMIDDRDQVVNHARDLGFTVFQVAEGNF